MAETKLSTHTNEALFLRDKNLVEDVMGKMSFTDAMFYHIMGVTPSDGQRAILDAVLVTLMEHGFTPSAISRPHDIPLCSRGHAVSSGGGIVERRQPIYWHHGKCSEGFGRYSPMIPTAKIRLASASSSNI
jgi:hypothetical protein